MTLRTQRMWTVAIGVAMTLTIAPAVSAQQWSERTVLKFTEPVMVPGATLQPGTYIFRLVDSDSNRHMVRILSEDESKVLATTLTVPALRREAKGDTVLRLNPTDSGTPAIKAWFYPGTLYGHQFVYSDEEARRIAERTKTVVLSHDIAGTDMEGAVIHVYDPAGNRTAWQDDPTTVSRWREWHRSQTATASIASPAGATEQSTAPMYAADRRGTTVTVDELENNPSRFLGKTISVDAEVEKVLGPRLFTIDERNWMDLEGEILVHMPTNLAAFVKEGDLVTVTGTPRAFARDDFDDEWGWLDTDDRTATTMDKRPVLIASRVVGGNSNVAMVINAPQGTPEAVGTTGTTPERDRNEVMRERSGALSDVAMLANGSTQLVGRQVKLTNQNIASRAKDGGFWIQSSGKHVYVLPSSDELQVTAGQRVNVEGVVLQMPRGMRNELKPKGDWNDAVYVFATNIER